MFFSNLVSIMEKWTGGGKKYGRYKVEEKLLWSFQFSTNLNMLDNNNNLV